MLFYFLINQPGYPLTGPGMLLRDMKKVWFEGFSHPWIKNKKGNFLEIAPKQWVSQVPLQNTG